MTWRHWRFAGEVHRSNQWHAPHDLFSVALVTGIAVFLITIILVIPRPYTLYESDIENSYLYNAKIWADGFVTPGECHPGMPARYAYLAYLKLGGTDTGPVFQRALYVAYWLIGLLYVLGGIVAYRVLAPITSPLAAATGVVAGLTLPPSLYFVGYFGADSFLLPVLLPLVAFTWRTLDPAGVPSRRELVVAGVLAGTALSVKLSSVPLILVIGVSLAVSLTAGGPSGPLRRAMAALRSVWFWVSAIGIHLLFCLPLHIVLLEVWKTTFLRPDTKPDLKTLGNEFGAGLAALGKADPLFVLLVIGLVVGWVWSSQRQWPMRLQGVAAKRLGAGRLVFIAALTVSVTYALSLSGRAVLLSGNIERGFPLRNSLPVLLGAVPLIATGVQRVLESDKESKCKAFPRCGVWIVLAGMVLTSVGIQLVLRWRSVTWHRQRSEAAQVRFEKLRPVGTRIAFWDGSPGDYFGDASFRFWGNYRWYRHPGYDTETLRLFPRYTSFHLRDVARIIDRTVTTLPEGRSGLDRTCVHTRSHSWIGRLARGILKATFERWFPRWNASRCGYDRTRLFTEDPGGRLQVGLVVWPLVEEPHELAVPRARLLELLRKRMGPVKCWEEEIAGVRWIIVRKLAGKGPGLLDSGVIADRRGS